MADTEHSVVRMWAWINLGLTVFLVVGFFAVSEMLGYDVILFILSVLAVLAITTTVLFWAIRKDPDLTDEDRRILRGRMRWIGAAGVVAYLRSDLSQAKRGAE